MPYAKGQSGNPKGRPKPMTDTTRTDSMLVSTSLTRLMVQILLFF